MTPGGGGVKPSPTFPKWCELASFGGVITISDSVCVISSFWGEFRRTETVVLASGPKLNEGGSSCAPRLLECHSPPSFCVSWRNIELVRCLRLNHMSPTASNSQTIASLGRVLSPLVLCRASRGRHVSHPRLVMPACKIQPCCDLTKAAWPRGPWESGARSAGPHEWIIHIFTRFPPFPNTKFQHPTPTPILADSSSALASREPRPGDLHSVHHS